MGYVSSGAYRDPGWFKRPPAGGFDGLVTLRYLFLSLVQTPLLMLAVLAYIMPIGSVEVPIAVGLAALAIGGVVVVRVILRRPLDTSSAAALALSYRRRFFLSFALNEIPLFVGFIFCFLRDGFWAYLVVLPIFLVGMALIAPTRRNLDRTQQQILHQGSPLSLSPTLSSVNPQVARGQS